jgi:hypothetical protein
MNEFEEHQRKTDHLAFKAWIAVYCAMTAGFFALEGYFISVIVRCGDKWC